MKRVLLFLAIILVAASAYWFLLRKKEVHVDQPKQAAISVKKHSSTFNDAIDKVLGSYLTAKDAFVDADTVTVKKNIELFIQSLDSIPLAELKADSSSIYETALASIQDIRSNAQSLLLQSDITEMRKDFSMVTEMMYPAFLKAINYEGEKLYIQNCPMAFDDVVAANWLSKSDEIVNPYLGKYHAKYKDKMLHCGEVKDSIWTK